MKPLKNDRQELFCQEYIIDLNATLAAERAKYSKKTAASQGARLLKNVKVAERIAHLKSIRAVQCNIDAQWVLNRLNEIDALDVIDILDDDGNMLPIKDWPKSWRTSISGLDVQKLIAAGKDLDAIQMAVMKIKWPDKVKNLEMIGRHVNVRAWEKEQVEGNEELAAVMRELADSLPV